MKVKDITVTFENGDVLTLSLRESTFAGFKPAKLFELIYGERHMRETSPSSYKEDPSYFETIQTEYFPATEFSSALSAFNKRLTCSNPKNESDMGWDLNKILEYRI